MRHDEEIHAGGLYCAFCGRSIPTCTPAEAAALCEQYQRSSAEEYCMACLEEGARSRSRLSAQERLDAVIDAYWQRLDAELDAAMADGETRSQEIRDREFEEEP